MSLENIQEIREFNRPGKTELPRFHLELLGAEALEQLTNKPTSDVLSAVSEKIFQDEVSAKAGLEGAFLDAAREGTRKEFSQAYEDYVLSPRELEVSNPEMYQFLKERIFLGQEYTLQGMEDFQNKTAPRSWEATQELQPMEIPLPASENIPGMLEKYRILDPEIGEGTYYSHGSAAEMAKVMDIHQGDNRFGALGTCGLVSVRNLLALCGDDVTESELVTFAKIYEYADFDSILPSEKLGSVYVSRLPELTERHGVSTELTKSMSMEQIADKLDHGYRGLFVHNAALLEGVDQGSFSLAGKLADHVATFESAVRDGSGNVKGFYVGTSSYTDSADAQHYVSVENMEKALDVKGGALLFTTEPYLNT
ncbi:MAG: hypothetical protein J6J12_03940 [Oscillospiraceae bacterium]|nr:hypothetical protein [Oscillospiraceae bacterium]